MTVDQTLWMAWWNDADIVVRSVFVLLIAMSLASWSLIIYKARQLRRILRLERASADLIPQARDTASLASQVSRQQPLSDLLQVLDTLPAHPTARAREMLERQLNQVLREWQLRLESGLTLLATAGNAAPFIGLFGTVWGIMHALHTLGDDPAFALDAIAGPVSEALVATAAGIFTAVPAVTGYNLLVRRLRNLAGVAEGNAVRLLGCIEHEQRVVEPAAAVCSMKSARG